jgi:hypothetical protein
MRSLPRPPRLCWGLAPASTESTPSAKVAWWPASGGPGGLAQGRLLPVRLSESMLVA